MGTVQEGHAIPADSFRILGVADTKIQLLLEHTRQSFSLRE
jgi:hypothetical protein